jgi:hypothetical protein
VVRAFVVVVEARVIDVLARDVVEEVGLIVTRIVVVTPAVVVVAVCTGQAKS